MEPKLQCRVLKNSSLYPILKRVDLDHILAPCVFMLYMNILLSTTNLLHGAESFFFLSVSQLLISIMLFSTIFSPSRLSLPVPSYKHSSLISLAPTLLFYKTIHELSLLQFYPPSSPLNFNPCCNP